MFRKFLLAAALLLAAISTASAADYSGKVTAFDKESKKVTVHADDKDQAFALAKDCKIYVRKGAGKRAQYVEDPKGIKDVVAGATVEISTDFVDGNEVVTLLKITGREKREVAIRANWPEA